MKMFCNMCGANIPDGADFCPNCGANLSAFKQPQPAQEPAQEAVTDAVQEPVQEAVTDAVQEPVQEAVTDAVQEPVQEAVTEAVQEPTQDTVQDIAEQAAKEAAEKVAQEAAEAVANAEPQQISAASTTPMMDIPIADAPDEIDPESGTTVLTADMSGPLTSSFAPSGFEEAAEPEATASEILVSQQVAGQVAGPAPESAEPIKDEAHQHEFQAPEGKIVTPAPVTGSSILSDASVVPVSPTAQEQPAPQAAPVPGVQSQPQTVAQNRDYSTVQPAASVQAAQQTNSYNQYMPAGGSQGITVINQMQSGDVPENYKPISPWGYLGYTLLFNIPLVGLILMFVWGFGGESTNKNLKNYARFFLLVMLISLIISIIIGVISAIMGVAIFGALSDY